jgi:hypothetical protein
MRMHDDVTRDVIAGIEYGSAARDQQKNEMFTASACFHPHKE